MLLNSVLGKSRFWLDSATDIADAPFPFRFPQRFQSLGQSPFRVTAVLVFEVMEMDDVEIFRAESSRAFVERSADAGARVIERVVAVAAGLCVFADFGPEVIAVTRNAFERLAEDGFGHGAAVSRSHVEVVDAKVERGLNSANAFGFVRRAIDAAQRRRAEAESRDVQAGIAEGIVFQVEGVEALES